MFRKYLGTAERDRRYVRHQPNKTFRLWSGRVIGAVLASMLAFFGLAAFGTAAFAHANIITGVASCATPLGSGYKVLWTVSNDYNLPETAEVTVATGGISSVTPVSFGIAASGNGSGGYANPPYRSATLTQVLPASSSGTVGVTVASKFSDNFTTSNSGLVALPGSCAAVAPTLSSSSAPPAVVVAQPGISIVKTERVGSLAVDVPFVRGPVRAVVGQTLEYQIAVTNTGTTSLSVVVHDPRCDPKSLAPVGTQQIAVGASLTYSCWHVLVSVPNDHLFRNVATATGTSPQGISVGPVASGVNARVFSPSLQARTLKPAVPAVPILRSASFTG